ncbi:MAG: hypothetical protein P4L49_03640 [Desulfosporosinus sp.]|nr:hypothetical protein [Desulfosporosinus sp.]
MAMKAKGSRNGDVNLKYGSGMNSLVSTIVSNDIQLRRLIKDKGIDNIRFMAYIRTSDFKVPIEATPCAVGLVDFVECKLDESIYPVSEWYKLTLIPTEETGVFGYEHYYITTIVSLINEGSIYVKVLND